MPRKNQAGCGCCCVDLTVDNDQASTWDRDTDATYGTDTVTILRSVPLCNFRMKAFIDGPATSGLGYPDFEGTITAYFLSSPTDANVDAIGYATLTLKDAVDSSNTRTEPLPFYIFPTAAGIPTAGYTIAGTGEVHIPAMGIINETFTVDATSVVSFSVQSTNECFQVIPFGFCHNGGTTPSTVDNLGPVLTLNRSSCTEQKVYIRYVTEGDLDLATDGVKFELQTLNPIGDQSCRTETAYYDAGPESGNCTSPTDYCGVFQSQVKPWSKLAVSFGNVTADPSGTKTVAVDLWLYNSADTSCTAAPASMWSDEPSGLGGSVDAVIVLASMETTCESGTIVYSISLSGSSGLDGSYSATWTIELDLSYDHPSDVPQTNLTQANSDTWSFPAAWTVSVTLN